MQTAEEIMMKHIPKGVINLKSYQAEKSAIVAAMVKYAAQFQPPASQLTQTERATILKKIMHDDEELGLYDDYISRPSPEGVEVMAENKITETVRAINPDWNYGETHDDVFRQLLMFFDPPVVRRRIIAAMVEMYQAGQQAASPVPPIVYVVRHIHSNGITGLFQDQDAARRFCDGGPFSITNYEVHITSPVQQEDELKYAMGECERLSEVAKYWQEKYYEVVPPFQRPNIDNL